MTAHKHAHLMAEYAKDAMETDAPWERWEVKFPESCRWNSVSFHPNWSPWCEYRRRPRTININGHEVPEPVNEIRDGQTYFIPVLDGHNPWTSFIWGGDGVDRMYMGLGLMHLTKEAAEAHARALLSFTEK